MNSFSATYFDGFTIRAVPAVVEAADDGTWTVCREGLAPLSYAHTDLDTRAPLGRTPRIIRLPDGGTLETLDPGAEAMLAPITRERTGTLVHWLESRARVALAATVMVAALLASSIYWGVPAASRALARRVPAEIEQTMGRAALRQCRTYTLSSQLDGEEYQRVKDALARVSEASGYPGVHIEYRRLRYVDLRSHESLELANAFALPGRVIVVTDQLVRLATDDELAAVLAHEFGHLEAHHQTQQLLRDSLALLAVATVTGDLSTLNSAATALPMRLLETGYSRDFEREADAQAVQILETAKIDPEALATILTKLEKASPPEVRTFSYLSTHPPTPERIDAIHAAARKRVKTERSPRP